MSTVIQTKRSVTTGVVPASLEEGELAVNIIDKKLWVGGPGGSGVELLVDYAAFITGGGGGGGETYYEGYGININTNNVISVDDTVIASKNYVDSEIAGLDLTASLTDGYGIDIDTDNNINLNLNTVTVVSTTVDKTDKIPFLDISVGTTKVVTVHDLMNYGLKTALSTETYNPGDPTTDERVTVAIQDNNPNAFSIQTLQNASGDKLNIIQIDTSPVSGSVLTLRGTDAIIQPSDTLSLGSITSTISLLSTTITLTNADNISFSVGEGSIDGLVEIVSGAGNTVYIQGNLVVSGFIETDVGIRGGTDVSEEYLGLGMVLDGGTFT